MSKSKKKNEWVSGLFYVLEIAKYLFLAAFVFFIVYVIGLLRRNVD